MSKLIILFFLFVCCVSAFVLTFEPSPKLVQTKKYAVMSSFNDLILETEDEKEAYKTAQYLNLMGRVYISKPVYFVVEK